ncbi:MAG: cytochrome B [Rhodospirillaceae bacterium]|nr:MAG: cytochrome B [Rhodospirillaceae bacterium]
MSIFSRLRNDLQKYGLISVFLHWVMAAMIIGLFVLGKYMIDLNYYSPWYTKAPDMHYSFGIIVTFLLIFRLGWRMSNLHPKPIGKTWEKHVAIWVHRLFYALIATIVVSGYLITTAKGQAIPVFGWFNVPATLYDFSNQEDVSGVAHKWLANALIALVILHTMAALKHHFIDRDATLRRMSGRVKCDHLSQQQQRNKLP